METNNTLQVAVPDSYGKSDIAIVANRWAAETIRKGLSAEMYVKATAAKQMLDDYQSAIKGHARDIVDELCGGDSSTTILGVNVQIKSAPVRYTTKGIKTLELVEAFAKQVKKDICQSSADYPYTTKQCLADLSALQKKIKELITEDNKKGEVINGVEHIHGEDILAVVLNK